MESCAESKPGTSRFGGLLGKATTARNPLNIEMHHVPQPREEWMWRDANDCNRFTGSERTGSYRSRLEGSAPREGVDASLLYLVWRLSTAPVHSSVDKLGHTATGSSVICWRILHKGTNIMIFPGRGAFSAKARAVPAKPE